jgi:FkbM family methyltransferase
MNESSQMRHSRSLQESRFGPLTTRFPLRRKTVSSVLRGIFHGLIAPWCSHRTFAVADYQVMVPARSLFARQLAKYRAYEPVNSNWLISTVECRPQDLYVDVGANFGWYSMLLARVAPRASIVAIEPGHENFTLLQRNIERNRFVNIVAINRGAGAQPMQSTLFAHEQDNPGAHSIRQTAQATAGEVIRIEPLDRLLEAHPGRIGLLKIDVEGYEMDVLLGAKETLERTDQILLEYSPDFLSECGHHPLELLDNLQRAGFHPHRVSATGLEPVARDRLVHRDPTLAQGHRWQVDLVFVRDGAGLTSVVR